MIKFDKKETQSYACSQNFSHILHYTFLSSFCKTYLALPVNKSLTEGHCLILPLHHVIGQTYMDEDVTQEVKVS